MRIINTDNFSGDYPDESFLSFTNTESRSLPLTVSKEKAEKICEVLNSIENYPHASRYYRVVEDNYKLQPGFVP